MNSHVRCLINQSEARFIQRTQCTPFSFRRFSLFMWIIFLRSAKFMEFFMVRTFSNIDAKMSESESERWINGCGTIVCDISLLQWIDRMFIQLLTNDIGCLVNVIHTPNGIHLNVGQIVNNLMRSEHEISLAIITSHEFSMHRTRTCNYQFDGKNIGQEHWEGGQQFDEVNDNELKWWT